MAETYEEYSKRLNKYVEALRNHCPNGDGFANLRGFKRETVENQKIFYVPQEVDMLVPEYMSQVRDLGVISQTNDKPIFHDRYVMPIFDAKGNVLNLVGYNKNANERYIYGTAKFYSRTDCLYGLENLEMAYNLGYAILTEGITDTIRLRDLGYLNSFAKCGTTGSEFVCRQLNRCRFGVIHIGDRDSAGQQAIRRLKFFNRIILNIDLRYKDIDEMCSKGNSDTAKSYIDYAITEITKREHNRLGNVDKVFTMV